MISKPYKCSISVYSYSSREIIYVRYAEIDWIGHIRLAFVDSKHLMALLN